MRRLVYFSTARLGLGRRELEKILEGAAAHNRAAGVTGVLLYNGFNFLQVLEGPETAVERLYQRICVDGRHHGVTTIAQEEIERAAYPDWGMKLKEIDPGVLESDRLRASEEVANSLIDVSRQDIRRMIEAFFSLN